MVVTREGDGADPRAHSSCERASLLGGRERLTMIPPRTQALTRGPALMEGGLQHHKLGGDRNWSGPPRAQGGTQREGSHASTDCNTPYSNRTGCNMRAADDHNGKDVRENSERGPGTRRAPAAGWGQIDSERRSG